MIEFEFEMPDAEIGKYFEITFPFDAEIIPLHDQDITIQGSTIKGMYTVDDIIIKTVKGIEKYEFTKFNIPKDHEIYHFITTQNRYFDFEYKVDSAQGVETYIHRAYVNWTTASEGFRTWLE